MSNVPVFSRVRVDDLFLGPLLPFGKTLILTNSLSVSDVYPSKHTMIPIERGNRTID
jgi:hypothetical protein